jgi:hypothetical protein
VSFEDEIKKRLDGSTEVVGARFVSVLEELAKVITTRGDAVAKVEEGTDPRRRYLVLEPLYRPGRQHSILSFWIRDDSQLYVSGVGESVLRTPEKLQAWLLNFISQPAFLETLSELKLQSTIPVEGYLRAFGAGHLSRDDVMVKLEPAEQEKLAKAPPGAVEVRVGPIDFPGAGTFDGAKTYKALEAAGLIMAGTKCHLDGTSIVVSGTKA